MKASTSMVITRPIAEVFAFVADPLHMDRWVSGVTEPQRSSSGDLGVGSTFASKYTYAGKTHDITYIVTAYESPRRYDVKSTSGPFPFEGRLDLVPVGTGTRITNTINAGSDSRATSIMFVLFGPILRRMMRQRLHKELDMLKAVLKSK